MMYYALPLVTVGKFQQKFRVYYIIYLFVPVRHVLLQLVFWLVNQEDNNPNNTSILVYKSRSISGPGD